MGTRIKNGMRYVKAAPWPYLTGGTSAVLALVHGAMGLNFWSQEALPQAAVSGYWLIGSIVVAFFAMADGVSRYRECQRIKAMFLKFGYSERILEPLAKSRCQRDAAIFAADGVGHGGEARIYFFEKGYRWYHILPDSVIRNPLNFMRPSFIFSAFLPGKKARA